MHPHLRAVLLMALLCLPSTVTKASTLTPEQALIKGIAQWQAGRVEELLVSQVFNQVFADPYVKRYFPLTVRNMLIYDGSNATRLIPIAEHYLKQDLANVERLVGVCLPEYLTKSLMLAAGVATDGSGKTVSPDPQASVAKLVALYQVILNLSIDPEEDTTARASALQDEAQDIKNMSVPDNDLTAAFRGSLALTGGRVVDIEQLLLATCEDSVTQDSVETNLKALKAHFVRAGTSLTQTLAALHSAAQQHDPSHILPSAFASQNNLRTLFQSFEASVKAYQEAKANQSPAYTVLAHQLLVLIDRYGAMRKKNIGEFTKLRESTLFLAELVDAANTQVDPDALVATVLKRFVDGEGALLAKRKPTGLANSFTIDTYQVDSGVVINRSYTRTCRTTAFTCHNTLFIGSFYGLSVVNGQVEGTASRAFGPIGLEWKPFVWRGRPITLNFAPIDIGNYVTSELTGKDYSASLDDVVAPSVFVALSGRSAPVALLLGYQKGIRVEEDIEDESWFLALTFDLPMFTLY